VPSGLPDVSQAFTAETAGYIAGIQRMIAGNKELLASIREVKNALDDLGISKTIRIDVDNSAALAKIAEVKAALDSLGDAHAGVSILGGGGDNGAMVRHLQDISTYMDMATDSMQRMEDHLVVIKKNTGDASADLMMQTQILRDNADAHHAAADAVAAFSAATSAAGGGRSYTGGGGGGGRGRWTSAAYAAAGGGPDFPKGTAGHDAAVITGFVKRWWTPVHFAIMTANELMATMLPAAAAAGAATLVGWQGVEQMIPRFQAINATAEALGGAYGITSGQYLGTGSAIQRAQNLATGGVYELGGAGINLARMGAGGFAQTGLSTIAMLDRGVADMQINMQNRGTMGLLQSLAGGGTGYLRQFGDIGANFGNILLGLAPHLPGVGGDYLSALEGITGALGGGIGFMNQHGLGNVLGAGMAAEAGWRIGRPVVGLAGRGLIGLGDLLGNLGLEGLGGGVADAGIGLGMLGGPEVAGLALSAFLGSKLISSMPSPAERQVAALQAGIDKAGFSAAFHPLAKAITTTTGLASSAPTSGLGAVMGASQSIESFARFGPQGPTTADIYRNAATGFSQTMGDLVNAGPELVSSLKKAGLKGVDMADAFQVAQNALLDLPHAFGKDGKLTQQAQQMLKNYVSAIGPMTQSAGGFNAAIAAQQIMGSPAMKNLSGINQAMDSMTQIMSGGPAGMATLFGMLGGTPTTVSHGGMKLAPPPAVQAMAKALTSFTSASGASAWNTFAGSQGLVAAEQQNLDQLRTYMTLGSIGLQGKSGAQGIAAFQLQQLLPMASKSPAALAMLMQQGAQMGVTGYYDPSKSQGANFEAAKSALAAMAGSSKQVAEGMNHAVIAASNLPKTAMQFTQGIQANLQSQQIAQASKDLLSLKAGAGKGIISQGALTDLVAQFRAAGIQGGNALKNSLDAAMAQAGISKAMRIKIEAQVNTQQIQAQLNAIKDKQVHAKVNVDGAAQLRNLQNEINALSSKQVRAAAQVQGAGAVAALNAEIAALHSKVVTITTRMITIGGMAGVTPGIPAGVRAPGLQTGGLVPGTGSGDIIPSMLEPGEAIVPRNLVPLVAPILAAHRVPGFGAPQSSASHFASGGVAGGGSHPWLPYWEYEAKKHGWAPTGHHAGASGGAASTEAARIAKEFSFTLTGEIAKEIRNSAGAKNIAQALVNKIGQEIQYAKQVSSSITSGLNLGGMDLTQGSVLQQMQNYAASAAAFGTDLATLRKQGLAKGLISQIVAAGPVQGDALAQSILGTGVKGINQLWHQIGGSAHIIGAQAAMAQYGGMLAPNLRSGSFTSNNVTISLSAKGGTTLSLTNAQIKQLVELIQAKLLQQARRNQKTGLQAQGKGA